MIMQSFFFFSSFFDNYKKLAREVFPDQQHCGHNPLHNLKAPDKRPHLGATWESNAIVACTTGNPNKEKVAMVIVNEPPMRTA